VWSGSGGIELQATTFRLSQRKGPSVTKTQSVGPISYLEHCTTRVLHGTIVTRAAVLMFPVYFRLSSVFRVDNGSVGHLSDDVDSYPFSFKRSALCYHCCAIYTVSEFQIYRKSLTKRITQRSTHRQALGRCDLRTQCVLFLFKLVLIQHKKFNNIMKVLLMNAFYVHATKGKLCEPLSWVTRVTRVTRVSLSGPLSALFYACDRMTFGFLSRKECLF